MRKRVLGISFAILLGLVISVATWLGIQYFTKTGLFKIPGEIIYSRSLTDAEIRSLHAIFYDDTTDQMRFELDEDVEISSHLALTQPTDEHALIYQVYLPVTDFYSAETRVSSDAALSAATPVPVIDAEAADTESTDAEVLSTGTPDPAPLSGNGFKLIPVAELDFTRHLLAIDDKYYLDDPSAGAVFVYYTVSGENPDDIALVEEAIRPTLATFPKKEQILTFAQTGVTALSRGMTGKLNSVGSGKYFSEYIAPFLRAFDLTHTSNEASFTTAGSRANICSPLAFKDTLLDIGLDIVELTGNHNQDCGASAARDSIDFYNANNIKIVGGGKTAAEAKQPLLINEKGTGITMLGYNLSTGGWSLSGNTPGANHYNEDDAKKNIAAAKERGDFIIIDIQFYECAAYDRATWTTTCIRADSTARDPVYGSESQFFRHLIDLGADMVVGTAAHQTQTYELYKGGVIYYGLGNLFFDQIKWPDTTRSLVLGHYFYNGKLLQTRLHGTIYGNDYRTRLMNEEEQRWFINQLVAMH